MVQKSHSQPPGMVLKPVVNNGINYQPQQVQDFFHQQYEWLMAMPAFFHCRGPAIEHRRVFEGVLEPWCVSILYIYIIYMDVSKNRGTPKWMVKIMENPINMGWFGWVSPYFWVDTHIFIYKYRNINGVESWNLGNFRNAVSWTCFQHVQRYTLIKTHLGKTTGFYKRYGWWCHFHPFPNSTQKFSETGRPTKFW